MGRRQGGLACRMSRQSRVGGTNGQPVTLGRPTIYGSRLMNIIVLIIVLMLLFGGGGFYYGGPYVGGGLGTILLIVLIVVLVRGG